MMELVKLHLNYYDYDYYHNHAFQAWCAWAGITIRHDKCNAFSMMKKKNTYLKIKPILTLNAENIFTVPIDGQFTYLGRLLSFDLNHESEKQSLKNKLEMFLKITDSLKKKAQTKLRFWSLYIHSQMLFELNYMTFL